MFKTSEELKSFLTNNIKVSYKERYYGEPELSAKSGKAMRKLKFRTENRSGLHDSILTLFKYKKVKYSSHLVRSEQTNLEVIDVKTEECLVRILIKPKFGNEWKQQSYWNLQMQNLPNWSMIKSSPDTNIEYQILKTLNYKIAEMGMSKPVEIVMKTKRYKDIIGFIAGSFGAKADFIGVNSKGQKVLFISHKDGSSPRDFQQYSGITSKAGNSIYNHKEVKSFREDIARKDPEDFYKNVYYREITDYDLKKKSVFGKDYGGGPTSENNIDFFCQGNPIIIKKNNSVLDLRFSSKMIYRDQISQLDRNEYNPVLAARRGEMYRSVEYMGDRVSGVRGGIFAKGYIDNRTSEKI